MGKILITGSQGFIGSYLCADFLNKGYQVVESIISPNMAQSQDHMTIIQTFI